MRWEVLKCFLRGHTINYSYRKKKMLSMRKDALENFIKYEETNLLTTNDTQTAIDKIYFYSKIFKTKIAIADYLLNTTATETNPHMRWEVLKCFLRGHTINYSYRKKKMLSMRKDALENFIKYEETNLLTTNDTQTTIDKISFYQNELENMAQNRTKGAIVRS